MTVRSATNAIDLLTHDHRVVEALFTDFEKAGDRAFKTKQHIVEKFSKELTVHAFCNHYSLVSPG